MIKKLLEKLLCKHKWEVHESVTLYNSGIQLPGAKPYGRRQTLICKECGKIKKITL